MSNSQCPVHPDDPLIEDSGDVFCSVCGLVVSDGKNGPSSNGPSGNHLLESQDNSGSNEVGCGASGSAESLRNAQRTSVSYVDRQMMKGYKIIREMSEQIHIPPTLQDSAAEILKKALDCKAAGTKKLETQVAVFLYIACRQKGVPRTYKEICAVFGISVKEIHRVMKMIMTSVNLDLPGAVQDAAAHIAKKTAELDLVQGSGRSPISIAAGAIYLASRAPAKKLTAEEITETAGTNNQTIIDVYKTLLSRAAELFPENFDFVTPIERLPFVKYRRPGPFTEMNENPSIEVRAGPRFSKHFIRSMLNKGKLILIRFVVCLFHVASLQRDHRSHPTLKYLLFSDDAAGTQETGYVVCTDCVNIFVADGRPLSSHVNKTCSRRTSFGF